MRIVGVCRVVSGVGGSHAIRMRMHAGMRTELAATDRNPRWPFSTSTGIFGEGTKKGR